jgi:hypothetical protein
VVEGEVLDGFVESGEVVDGEVVDPLGLLIEPGLVEEPLP